MASGKDKTSEEEKAYYSLNKRAWDILAPFYDIIVLPFSRIRKKVVTFTNTRMDSKVLDVATGTGKQAFAFARMGCQVVGIDLSEAMLEIATRKNKYGNLRFAIADATKLPFADNSFDVVCVSFALHEMPLTIMEKVLKEMVRVTRPQRAVVIIDYGLPRNRIGRFFIYHFVKLYEGKPYSRFIRTDLNTLLRKSKVEVKAQMPMLLGAVGALKGTKGHAV